MWPLHASSFAEARARAAPAHLARSGADVIALQKVFRPRHRRDLRQAMHPTHPHIGLPGPRRSLLGTGLMVLSRLPILDCRFHRQPSAIAPLFERGALSLTIATPSGGRLPLVVVHLEPGALARPAPPRRLAETAFMLATARPGTGAATLLAGDFNCSPAVSPDIYGQIIAAGYEDAHRSTGGDESPTWDAANPLNQASRHRDHPSQRIDHVFIPRGSPVRPVSSRIVLQDAAVPTRGGTVPLSDHYGLQVEVSVPPPETGQATRP